MRRKSKKKRKAKKLILAAVLAAGAVLLIYGKTVMSQYSEAGILTNLLDLGAKYPEVMDYESAVALFESVLKIDPQETGKYIDMLESYLPPGELAETLGDLSGYGEAEQYDKLKELLDQVMELLPEEFQTEIKKQLGWMEEIGQ